MGAPMSKLRVVVMCVLLTPLIQGCSPCEKGTLLLLLSYDGDPPNRILLTLEQQETSTRKNYALTPKKPEDSVLVRFSEGYRQGAKFLVTVDGFDTQGTQVLRGTDEVTLAQNCTMCEVPISQVQSLDFPISHIPQHYLTDGTCDLSIPSAPSTHIFDTGTGQLDNSPLIPGCLYQAETNMNSNGESFFVIVLAVNQLIIPTGVTLQIRGPYPLAIVAKDVIQINGTLDGSADLTLGGPGGRATGSGVGLAGLASTNSTDSGGAGGSYGSYGADAAPAVNGTSMASGGRGGVVYGDPSLLSSLEPGSSGGSGTAPNAIPACGLSGGGGGAIQLTAGKMLQLGNNARIHVNGGGGLGGCLDSAQAAHGGGGGGSGGALFLESPIFSVVTSAILTANGGGGGSGGSDNAIKQRGNDGQNGLSSATIAPGGPAVLNSNSGAGGDGAAGTTIATTAPSSVNTGGGGGGVGRIVLRTKTAPTTTPTMSPPANVVLY